VVKGSGEEFMTKSCMIYNQKILFGLSRRMRWAGHVVRLRDSRETYRDLVGRSEGKTALGRPRRRWKYNIKLILQKWNGAWACFFWFRIWKHGGLL